MAEYLFTEQNGRNIPTEDKIFGINRLAKELETQIGKKSVVNATLGSLLDDDGKLVVLSSVVEVLKGLNPEDYADYAPIGGTAEFKKSIKKAAFGSFEPDCFTEVVATPGGTGAVRNTISNFSKYGDKVLTSDWFWAPYGTIAQEIGRDIATFSLFDEKRRFNIASFNEKVVELLEAQGRLVILMNTPANNPTGYSLTPDDWENVIESIKSASKDGKKVALLVDAAYIDFVEDSEEYRKFLPMLEKLPDNILPIIAYSLSKTLTLYGMRSGAMICMTKNKGIAEEFVRVCEFSSRGTWSNCPRAAMTVLSKIYENNDLLEKVDRERSGYRDMLLRRGRAFESSAKEAGLEIVPFDSGFFASIPCDNSDDIGKELQKDGIFLVPLAKGLRVTVASISEEKCRIVPPKVRAAQKKKG